MNKCRLTYIHAYRKTQAYRQTDIHTHRHTGSQPGRQGNIQTVSLYAQMDFWLSDILADWMADWMTGRDRHVKKKAGRQAYTQSYMQTSIQPYRQGRQRPRERRQYTQHMKHILA